MASSTSQFQLAIDAIFQGWTALQLAVAHSFGGLQSRAKAEWLVGATEQWLKENSDVDSTELEDFLAEIMSAEFNTVAEDNSLAEVATKICRVYLLTQQGRVDEVNSIISSLKKSAGVSTSQRQQEESDDDDDAEMDIEEENVMNHINALELSNNIAEQEQSADPTPNGSDNTLTGGDKPTGEDDEWTTVTRGKGRRGNS